MSFFFDDESKFNKRSDKRLVLLRVSLTGNGLPFSSSGLDFLVSIHPTVESTESIDSTDSTHSTLNAGAPNNVAVQKSK